MQLLTDHVTRYAGTYINRDGMRTLMGAAQGRETYTTATEAQAHIDAEVRPCACWPGHFDPVGIYFD